MSRKLLKLGIVALFLISFAWICRSILNIVATTAPDFKILWSFAKYLQEGKNLYLNPNVPIPNPYPPMTFLFYLPLTFFSYPLAQAIFTLLSFASIIGVAFLSLKIVFTKVNPIFLLLSLSLILFSFPAKYTLGMGQPNSLAFLFLLFSYYFWRKKSSIFSGIFLAFSVSLKPVLGFLVFFFIIEKAWNVILYTFLTLLIETVMILLISNLTLFGHWVGQLLYYLPLSGKDVYYNQGFAGFISRLTKNIVVIKDTVILFSFALVSTTLVLAKKGIDNKFALSLFTITLLLIDIQSWQHHFIWLIFPFVLLSAYAVKLKNAVILGLIGIAYLLVSWNFKNPTLFWSFPRILLLSNQFYGTLILWSLNVYFFLAFFKNSRR